MGDTGPTQSQGSLATHSKASAILQNYFKTLVFTSETYFSVGWWFSISTFQWYIIQQILEILDNTSKSLWELSNMEVSEKYMKCMKDSMAFSWNRTCLKMVVFTFLCARSHFLIKFQWSCLSFSLLVDVFFLKLKNILCYKNELWQLMISPWVMSADQQSHA